MFTDTENWEISKLLAAILHLGNLQYEGEGPRWCTPSPTPPWVQGQHNTSLPGGRCGSAPVPAATNPVSQGPGLLPGALESGVEKREGGGP